MQNNIRNFVIIAHIDHGKSTLADRMLEITGTIESRKMRPQYLDQLELERERGITIKMAPVRMNYMLNAQSYVLNLIDTPGHSDFSYEVSRALAAVEGAILLVDATKGVQAQTLSNLRSARKAGLSIIGAVNKIDLHPPRLGEVVASLAELLGVKRDDVFLVSAKSGEGVLELVNAVVEKIPPPSASALASRESRALVFDSLYDDHKGILAYLRVFGGSFESGRDITFLVGGARCRIKEVGFFSPELKPVSSLAQGEIGYVATGLKEPAQVKIGDTILQFPISNSQFSKSESFALPGYREPAPVVFISFYPDGATKFEDLKRGLERLRLTDAALSFESDANEALGRGLKVGFLGQLHFDITASRLSREFGLEFVNSFPSIAYRVVEKGTSRIIKDPHDFPADPDHVFQPMIRIEILAPKEYVAAIANMKNTFDLDLLEVSTMGENVLLSGVMPLAELIRDFDDELKSISSGYASFSYELGEEAPVQVQKLEILVAGEAAPALTRIVFQKDAEREARKTVERLKELLPRQQFVQAVQARAQGRIIARETIPALRKDVTGYLYGGDRSRKMKLWKKQQRGKEKLKSMAKVNISAEVFRELLKK